MSPPFTADLTERAASAIRDTLRDAQAACLTSSFQAECVVLTHLLLEVRPDIPVLFLETFHHFPETLVYRDELAAKWGLNLVNLQAPQAHLNLWQTESTQACCAYHKVGPLFAALEDHDVWYTALRRVQSPSRANLEETEPFRLPTGKVLTRIAPLAGWTDRDVWSYAKDHDIELMSLYGQGYTSIGCAPCTTPPIELSNPRSGRWQGQKLECGIHIQAADSE